MHSFFFFLALSHPFSISTVGFFSLLDLFKVLCQAAPCIFLFFFSSFPSFFPQWNSALNLDPRNSTKENNNPALTFRGAFPRPRCSCEEWICPQNGFHSLYRDAKSKQSSALGMMYVRLPVHFSRKTLCKW